METLKRLIPLAISGCSAISGENGRLRERNGYSIYKVMYRRVGEAARRFGDCHDLYRSFFQRSKWIELGLRSNLFETRHSGDGEERIPQGVGQRPGGRGSHSGLADSTQCSSRHICHSKAIEVPPASTPIRRPRSRCL